MDAVPAPKKRRERELAVQVLYSFVFHPPLDEAALKDAYNFTLANQEEEEGEKPDVEPWGYAWELVKGVWKNTKKLDDRLKSHSANWKLNRIGKIELTILRVALFELTLQQPPPMVINEALELAHSFGAEKAIPFINGVLDSLAREERAEGS